MRHLRNYLCLGWGLCGATKRWRPGPSGGKRRDLDQGTTQRHGGRLHHAIRQANLPACSNNGSRGKPHNRHNHQGSPSGLAKCQIKPASWQPCTEIVTNQNAPTTDRASHGKAPENRISNSASEGRPSAHGPDERQRNDATREANGSMREKS